MYHRPILLSGRICVVPNLPWYYRAEQITTHPTTSVSRNLLNQLISICKLNDLPDLSEKTWIQQFRIFSTVSSNWGSHGYDCPIGRIIDIPSYLPIDLFKELPEGTVKAIKIPAILTPRNGDTSKVQEDIIINATLTLDQRNSVYRRFGKFDGILNQCLYDGMCEDNYII